MYKHAIHLYIYTNTTSFLYSVVSVIPIFPNLSALRSFRVLRPLRSVSKLPGLRKIIGALVESAEDLTNVMFLLAFLVICFSITGMLFWNGLLHARCRLTPFPVVLSSTCSNIGDSCWDEYVQNVTAEPDRYRCLSDVNDDPSWTQSTSPWFEQGPQDCIWPIDDKDERVCALSKSGTRNCAPLYKSNGQVINRTCGSNYDAFGNPRFIDSNRPYGYPRMKSGTFIQALNWGFTNYDSFLPAFLTTFQVITLEGWTDIMYQLTDAWSFAPTVTIFCIQVVLCGYIVLNLVLAVISKSLDEFEDENDEVIGDELRLGIIPEEEEVVPEEEEDDGHSETVVSIRFLRKVIGSQKHSTFIMTCIIMNTIILSIDYYGISEGSAEVLENLNTVFTAIFVLDVILCNLSFGKAYWR